VSIAPKTPASAAAAAAPIVSAQAAGGSKSLAQPEKKKNQKLLLVLLPLWQDLFKAAKMQICQSEIQHTSWLQSKVFQNSGVNQPNTAGYTYLQEFQDSIPSVLVTASFLNSHPFRKKNSSVIFKNFIINILTRSVRFCENCEKVWKSGQAMNYSVVCK
jgi:hypothetical protein